MRDRLEGFCCNRSLRLPALSQWRVEIARRMRSRGPRVSLQEQMWHMKRSQVANRWDSVAPLVFRRCAPRGGQASISRKAVTWRVQVPYQYFLHTKNDCKWRAEDWRRVKTHNVLRRFSLPKLCMSGPATFPLQERCVASSHFSLLFYVGS